MLTALAIIPGIILLVYVYRHDTIEKEPAGLIIKLLFFGVLSALAASVIELIGGYILGAIFYSDSLIYRVIMYFIVVAGSEEGMKYLFTKWGSWKDRAFNYRFDGIIYAVSVALGFAVFENILYVTEYGFQTALVRAVTAVPGHTVFGLFMGYFYGNAKLCEASGNTAGMKNRLKMAILVPLILHGIYDFFATDQSILAGIIFDIFVVALDIIAIKRLKRSSAEDVRIV